MVIDLQKVPDEFTDPRVKSYRQAYVKGEVPSTEATRLYKDHIFSIFEKKPDSFVSDQSSSMQYGKSQEQSQYRRSFIELREKKEALLRSS